ncbi:hypothetical protein [Pseudobutyrivibrio sp.]
MLDDKSKLLGIASDIIQELSFSVFKDACDKAGVGEVEQLMILDYAHNHPTRVE